MRAVVREISTFFVKFEESQISACDLVGTIGHYASRNKRVDMIAPTLKTSMSSVCEPKTLCQNTRTMPIANVLTLAGKVPFQNDDFCTMGVFGGNRRCHGCS